MNSFLLLSVGMLIINRIYIFYKISSDKAFLAEAVFFVFSLPPFFWTLSVCPFFNKDSLMFLPGIGGGLFAQETSTYSVAIIIFNTISFLLLWFLSIFKASQSHKLISFPYSQLLAILNISFILIYFLFEPSLIGFSEYSVGFLRRDYIESNEYFFGVFKRLPALKMAPLVCFIISGVGLLKTKRFALFFCSAVLTYFFYFVEASRGTLIVIFSFFFFIPQYIIFTRNIIVFALALLFFILSYDITLVCRLNQNAGIISNIYFYVNADTSFLRSPLDSLISTIQNISLSFPVFCEAISKHDVYMSQIEGFGDLFFVLSHSPLPGSIDNFRETFDYGKLCINKYTPFSMIAEYYLFLGFCGIFIYIALLLSVLFIFQKTKQFCDNTFSAFLNIYIFSFFISSSLYPIRTNIKLLIFFYICALVLYLYKRTLSFNAYK